MSSITSASNSVYYKDLYGASSPLNKQTSMAEEAASIMAASNVEQAKENGASDGVDDGKISGWSKVGSFFKGIGKTVANCVKSLNPLNPKNWGNILKVGAAVTIGILFPPAGVAMAAYAGIKGAMTIGKGAMAASSATTDAEAKAAWENIGSGSFQVGMSVVGAKAGLKAMKSTSGSAMSELGANGAKAGIGETGRAFLKDVKTFGRGGSEATKAAAQSAGETIGYKSAGFADTVRANYNSSTKGNVVTKSADAVRNTATDTLKSTRVGKAYENSASKAKLNDAGKETITSKANRMKDAAKEVRAENKLTRGVAKDNLNGTNSTRSAANATKQQASKNLAEFKRTYTKNAEGKWADAKGNVLDDATYNKAVSELESNVQQSIKNSTQTNNIYNKAQTGAKVRQAVKEQIKIKQNALNEASGKTAQQLQNEISALKQQLNNYSVNGKAYVTDNATMAEYNALTGRTGVFSNAYQNYADAATTAGYTKFGALTPGLADHLEPAHSEEEMSQKALEAQLAALGY